MVKGYYDQVSLFIYRDMKVNSFKVRKVPNKFKDNGFVEEEQSVLKASSENQQILEQIHILLKQALNINLKDEGTFQTLQYRDRMTKSSIKITSLDYEDKDAVEAWIGEVCRNILSTTFHYYLEEDMTFQQAKIYCCQEILRNISYYAEKHEVTAEFYQTIDNIMKDKIMPYLALKYPLSETVNANKALSRIVKEINNIEMISNDFFYSSNIVLEYRQNGNYNDIVMRVLNELISLADSPKAGQQPITVFKDFDNSMTEFFEKVYDPVWMAQKNLSENQSLIPQLAPVIEGMMSEKILKDMKGVQEAEKYKEKVQEYTHYEIGRKIPESVHSYTEDEIKSKHLEIKSPEVLRIMTKWCEELWEKFENENYYIDRSEGLTMLNSKQINILYEWFRLDLKQILKDEKAKIEKYMSNVENNLYQQEFKILQSELMSKESPFLNRYERVCGKFSTKVVDNLKNCIVIYLNRLIHGLMFISNEFFRLKLRGNAGWSSPPNLLSFKIGDLLRCRVSSHQREIIRLYQQLHSTSEKHPEKLKIIRVKNRLKSGTNDLLINVLYSQRFLAEIQLKVKEKVSSSRFSKCSYNFSHFIYEIQRSYFGPISQICSIWSNLDPRAKVYRGLVKKQNLNMSLNKISSCLNTSTDHTFQNILNSPFICSSCGKSFSSDNYFLLHKKCKKCGFYKCSLCQIKQRQSKDLINQLILDENVPLNLFEERSESLPSIGICLKIENNAEGKVNYFKVIKILQKSYVFFLKSKDLFELVEELKTEKSRSKFVSQHIVYEHYGQQPELFKQMTYQKAVRDFILPLYVEKCYKLQKEAISINNFSMNGQQLQKILKTPKDSKRAVKQIEITDLNLKDLDVIPDDFVNLELINVNMNKIASIQSLKRFKKLRTIFSIHNSLTKFPVSLCDLPLTVLSIGQNNISVFPPQFQRLQKLQIIRFNNNKMQKFPAPITKLLNIRQIYAFSNLLSEIPTQISNCSKLTLLKLNSNRIEKLPKSLQALVALQVLNLERNHLSDIDIQFKNMIALKELNLSRNKLSKVPACLNYCDSLVKLKLLSNKIQSVSFENISMKNIEEIDLSQGIVSSISHLGGIKSLKFLDLSLNKLQIFPDQICELKQLSTLILMANSLKCLPGTISQLVNLKTLNISQNKRITIPRSFARLKLSALLMNRCLMQRFYPQILQLKHLKWLNISDNSIKEMPVDIKNLKDLEIFYFGNNLITNMPSEIVELKNLKKISFKQQGMIEVDKILEISFNMIETSLNLSISNIFRLPNSIPFNSYLQDLNLSNNQIRILPASISNLVNLRKFILINNSLQQLCKGLFELKQLTTLNLRLNKLTKLPDCFNKLKKLHYLNIEDNQILEIPQSLRYVFSKDFELLYDKKDGVEYPLWLLCKDAVSSELRLRDKALRVLPKFNINNVYKRVYLDHNLFDDFPKELLIFNHLVTLDLSYNRIKQIPKGIQHLRCLANLNISNNLIEEIPEEIGKIGLVFLSVEGNPLLKLHETFSKLQELELRISPQSLEQIYKNSCLKFIKAKKLNLSKMQITGLPSCLKELTDVESLDVSGNRFMIFPEEILRLSSLNWLRIQGQPIKKLPEGLLFLSNLTTLIANDCQLQQLPSSLSQLRKLQVLQLNGNQLSKIPLNLTVTTLMLNSNKFTVFPLGITSNNNLKQLQLSDNRIKEFPQWLKEITLQKLSIERNLISSLPKFLSKTKIKTLEIEGNPIKAVQNDSEIDKVQQLKSKEEIQDKELVQR